MNNTSNFTLYASNSTPLSLDKLLTHCHASENCQSWIRSYTNKHLYVFIDKNALTTFLTNINRTLDQYLDDISCFLWNNNVIPYMNYDTTSTIDNYYVFDWKGSECVIFHLDLALYNNNSQTRYYAYCLIRHIYYYQNVMVDYYYMINNTTEDLTLSNKIKYLSACANNIMSYSLFQYTKLNYKESINDLLLDFVKNSNSSIGTDKLLYSVYTGNLKAKELFENLLELDANRDYHNNMPAIYTTSYSLIGNGNVKPICKHTSGNVYLQEELDKYYDVKSSPNVQASIIFKNFVIHYIKASVILSWVKKPSPKDIIVDIKSRHPSHSIFRRKLVANKDVLIRLGSTTPSKKDYEVEINSVAAITKSSNKLLMKKAFDLYNIKTPTYWQTDGETFSNNNSKLSISELPYPIIAKNIYGSRGTGNYKLDTPEELNRFIKRRTNSLGNYIFEEFMNYNKEYRVHVSTNGVFLVWRKLRRYDTPDNEKWFFNNSNCNWISDKNVLFNNPTNLNEIYKECIKALKAVGLTIGACDVRVENNNYKNDKPKENVRYSIIEINSAPAMAEVTGEAYINEFNKIIDRLCAV